jgi:hypothetical protein
MSPITTTDGAEVTDEDFGEGISELSSRSANGLDVALLWQECDNTAFVVVVDHLAGEAFQLDVHENDNALDMFHHPYAYAAHRRIDHGSPAHGLDLRIAA